MKCALVGSRFFGAAVFEALRKEEGVEFTRIVVPAADDDEASRAARGRLAAALAALDPAGGILDDGDGSGRHASKSKKDKKQKAAP